MEKITTKSKKKLAVMGAALITGSTLLTTNTPFNPNAAAAGAPITSYPGLTTDASGRGFTEYSVIPTITKNTVVTDNLKGTMITRKDTEYGTKFKQVPVDQLVKGESYVAYSNVAFYNGKYIDLKVTVIDYVTQNGAIADFGYDKIAVRQIGNKSMKFKHEFFEHGTITPVEIPLIYTYGDIDWNQYVAVETAKITGRIVATSDSSLGYETMGDFTRFNGDNAGTNPTDKPAWVSIESKSSNFTFEYGTNAEMDEIALDKEVYYANEYALPKISDLTKPIKSVSDANETGIENTLENGVEHYNYTIKHVVLSEIDSENYFNSYVFTDDLVDGLIYDTNKPLKITEEETGDDVTNKFDVKIDDNKITATLKDPKTADFYGKSYLYNFGAYIDPDFDTSIYLNEGVLDIPNVADVTVDDIKGETNPTDTFVPVLSPQIEKAESNEVLEIGQDNEYTLTVENPDVLSHQVTVNDNFDQFKEFGEYVPESVTIDGKTVTDARDTDAADVTDNRFSAVVDLPAKGKIVIKFKVKAVAPTFDNKLENTATLTPKDGKEVPSNKVSAVIQTPKTKLPQTGQTGVNKEN